VLGTYRAMFRAPDSVAFSTAGALQRFSMAVYPIGLVLLISIRTGHYSFAGVLSGVFVIANGIGNPVFGRLVDRFGQRRLLVSATAVHVACGLTIVTLAELDAADWTLIAPAALLGFTFLPGGSMVRARWSLVLDGRDELATAYSYESAIDEVIFTGGPVVGTVIATQLDPVWNFVLAALLTGSGALWLASQHRTEPPPHPAGVPHRSAMRHRGMAAIVVVAAAMGAMFAGSEVAMIAFAGQHHRSGLSGLLLACFAGGSAVSGFSYGARTHSGSVLDRFRRQGVLFGVLPLLFLAAANLAVLPVLAAVVGLGIAPALINGFALVEELIPGSALVEGMSWLVTGISVGYGVASAVTGRVADAFGPRAAFLVAIAAGVLVLVSSMALHARLRPVVAEPGDGEDVAQDR
jgi:MFS family permease